MVSKLYSTEKSSKCDKEIFVRKALKHLLGEVIIFYNTISILDDLTYSTYKNSYETKHPIICKRYLQISSISYYLGYGEDLEIRIYDWINYPNGFKIIKLNRSEILSLEGEFTEDKSFIKTIISLSDLNLSEQEFIFKAYDWDKYPKRGKKSNNVLEKITIPVTVKAKTLNLAYLEINKLENKNSKIQYTLELWK